MKRFLAMCLMSGLLGGPGTAAPLTIYTEISPPDQYVGPEGVLTGYAVDLVREIQKRAGNADPILVVPWVRGYQEALSKPNVVLFSMARTTERMNRFEWVGPLRDAVYNLYVKADSRIVLKHLDEARSLKLIGVYKEDVRDQYLSKLGFTNLDRSIDETIIFKKLMDGRIEALTSTAEGLGGTARAAGFKPEDIREALPFLKVQAYIAFSKGTSKAILKSWSAALESTKRDGVLEQLHRKYFPNRPLPGTMLVHP
jgi:polar amino acid transport system substrate-binding protein